MTKCHYLNKIVCNISGNALLAHTGWPVQCLCALACKHAVHTAAVRGFKSGLFRASHSHNHRRYSQFGRCPACSYRLARPMSVCPRVQARSSHSRCPGLLLYQGFYFFVYFLDTFIVNLSIQKDFYRIFCLCYQHFQSIDTNHTQFFCLTHKFGSERIVDDI